MCSLFEDFDFSATDKQQEKPVRTEFRSSEKVGSMSNIDFDVIGRIGSYKVKDGKTVVVTVAPLKPAIKEEATMVQAPVPKKLPSLKMDYPVRDHRVGVRMDYGIFRKRMIARGRAIRQAKHYSPEPSLLTPRDVAFDEIMHRVSIFLSHRNMEDHPPTGNINIGLDWKVLVHRMAKLSPEHPREFQDILHLRMALYLDKMMTAGKKLFGKVPKESCFSSIEYRAMFVGFCFVHELQKFGHVLNDDSSERLSLRDYRMVRRMLDFASDPRFFEVMEGYIVKVLVFERVSNWTSMLTVDGPLQKEWIACLAHSLVERGVQMLRRRMDMLDSFDYEEDDLKGRIPSMYIDACSCCTFSHRIHAAKKSDTLKFVGLSEVVPKCEFLYYLLDVDEVKKNGGLKLMGMSFSEERYVAALEAFLISDTNVRMPMTFASSTTVYINQQNYDFAKLALIIYLSHMHQVCYIDFIMNKLSKYSRILQYFQKSRSATEHVGWKKWQEDKEARRDMQERVKKILMTELRFTEENALQICNFAMDQIILRNTARSFLHPDVLDYTCVNQPEKTLKSIKGMMNKILDQVHCCLLCYEDEKCRFCTEAQELS